MGILISVINNKGGTGKSTTSVNLAVALARLNKLVLAVDIDSQCNTTDLLKEGIGETITKTLYDLMDLEANVTDPKDYIYNTIYNGLYILPNVPDTAIRGPKMVISGRKSLNILRDRLRPYALKNYDYTILDCPPNLEAFVISSLIASDFVLVPIQAGSKFSLQGLLRAKEFIDDIKSHYNADIRFLKLLITMVDSRTSICKSIISAVRQAFPAVEVFQETIPANTDFQKAEARGQSIFKYRIGAPGAAAYTVVAQELIAAVEGIKKEAVNVK